MSTLFGLPHRDTLPMILGLVGGVSLGVVLCLMVYDIAKRACYRQDQESREGSRNDASAKAQSKHSTGANTSNAYQDAATGNHDYYIPLAN